MQVRATFQARAMVENRANGYEYVENLNMLSFNTN